MKGFPLFFFTVLYLIPNLCFSSLTLAQESDKGNCEQGTSTPGDVVSTGPFNRDECSEKSQQQDLVEFVCQINEQNIPITYARTSEGIASIFQWNDNRYFTALYSPLQRCQEISFVLQKYYPQGLNYITTGRVNGQNVICLTSSDGGNCEQTLFTLRPDQSPDNILESIFGGKKAASGPISETNTRTYINLTEYLQQSAIANTNSPTEPQPANHSPLNEGTPAW